jgi:hypothetical protein
MRFYFTRRIAENPYDELRGGASTFKLTNRKLNDCHKIEPALVKRECSLQPFNHVKSPEKFIIQRTECPFLKSERNEAAVKWSGILETDIECVTV